MNRWTRAPKAPSKEGTFDWPTAGAGWVVPAAGVLGEELLAVLTPWRPGRSRTSPENIGRDSVPFSGVGNAMTAALRPRTRWWTDARRWRAMAAFMEISDPGDSDPGQMPMRGTGRGTRDGSRPDADLLDLEPGDQLAALTRRHADAVYRVAYSITRDADLAEDVSQDALLKAWQALPNYRGDAPLKNWLLRITHNTAISALRRRRDIHVDPAELPESAPSAHRSAEPSVEERVTDRASLAAFEDALGELDDLSRSIVVLREVEGMSYDEISDLLEVPLPTVKTRLLRARRVLSTALEGWRP